MIAVRIGLDRFLVWRLPEMRARSLVPGLEPLVSAGEAWLLCAVAEFRNLRIAGLPWPRQVHTAGWLIPCRLSRGGVGNAFIRMCCDDALLLAGMRRYGAKHAGIRISRGAVHVAGQVRARCGAVEPDHGLAWFDQDRCGLVRQGGAWARWPIAKSDWSWRFRAAILISPLADAWDARPVGAIEVAPTVACWGTPLLGH